MSHTSDSLNDASDDWTAVWDPVIARIGEPFRTVATDPSAVADPVEAGAIRKYLEPLEFDCPLHYDADVARAHGYPDVIAPYTSSVSFALLPMWTPGTTLFTSDERNAQPEKTSVKPDLPDWFPPITGYFATDMELEFHRPATVGDVLRMVPGPLVSCEPKETRVGRGAFVKSETLILNQHDELLVTMLSGTYLYVPHEDAS
jgi:hypothetical protein